MGASHSLHNAPFVSLTSWIQYSLVSSPRIFFRIWSASDSIVHGSVMGSVFDVVPALSLKTRITCCKFATAAVMHIVSIVSYRIVSHRRKAYVRMALANRCVAQRRDGVPWCQQFVHCLQEREREPRRRSEAVWRRSEAEWRLAVERQRWV